MTALLASSSSLPGRGEVEQGGEQRTGLVLRGSEQLGPNGPTCRAGAGHKRRRAHAHGANDIGKGADGSSGEAQKREKRRNWRHVLQTTRSRRGKWKEDNSNGNGGAGGSASRAGRDKEIGGGGKEGGGSDLVGVARKWLPTLPGQAKRTSVNLIRSDPPPPPWVMRVRRSSRGSSITWSWESQAGSDSHRLR
jgi:hypothetical protein